MKRFEDAGIKDYFEQGIIEESDFCDPCNMCKNNENRDDEYPCLFCDQIRKDDH